MLVWFVGAAFGQNTCLQGTATPMSNLAIPPGATANVIGGRYTETLVASCTLGTAGMLEGTVAGLSLGTSSGSVYNVLQNVPKEVTIFTVVVPSNIDASDSVSANDGVERFRWTSLDIFLSDWSYICVRPTSDIVEWQGSSGPQGSWRHLMTPLNRQL